MRSLSPESLAALSAPVIRIAQLVYLDFPGLPVALTSANYDIGYAGITYVGASGLGAISQIDDSPGEIKGLQLQMAGVKSEFLALALSDASVVQGAPVTIRLAILNDAGGVVDAPIDWTGYVDTMPLESDGETCTITLTAESAAVDLLRGAALTNSNADQQYLYPGDRAFEYVVPQADVPIVWPTKQYYIDSR
ncbi:hypothetical protein [Variovorax sp. R-27]|uniref:hypothetical protein n=1 Tax=Variovorax sp. R-27 TaxID=3404058 RepID=UPI003CED4D94